MYTVYISHSVSPWELAQVYVLAQEAERQGLQSFIPDRAWGPGDPLPAQIAEALQQAEVMLLFATSGGQHQEWVNQELQHPRNREVVALVEEKVEIEGISSENTVRFNRQQDMTEVVQDVTRHLRDLQQHRLQRRKRNLVAGLLLSGVVLLLLRGTQGYESKE